MRAAYQVLDKIKDKLRQSPNIQTVSFGDPFEVDLNKTTIFPLGHVGMGNVTFLEHKLELTINLVLLDIVDDNRDPATCLLYTSPSPRDRTRSRMPSSA